MFDLIYIQQVLCLFVLREKIEKYIGLLIGRDDVENKNCDVDVNKMKFNYFLSHGLVRWMVQKL